MELKGRVQLHRVLKVVGIIALLLLCGASYIGYSTARYMRDVIKDQFNDQQLVLARATAHRIENNIRTAIADISLLNSLPSIQYCEDYERLLVATLPVLNRDYITEIRRIDREGAIIFLANDQGVNLRHITLMQQEAGAYLSWAADQENRGKTMGTGIRPKDLNKGKRLILLDLITPTYEDSSDTTHPHPTRRFSGYLRATLDVTRLLQEIVPAIRSGKTGYAWVLDSSGSFLHHPEASFVGEDAFEVRANRNPAISFSRIDQIQRNEMLRGKEGIGTYISGWHRDVVEPMEKLIAYTPVRLQGPYIDYVWSVAVVAPVQEIEGVLGSVYDRQMLLQGLVIFLILLGSVIILLYELRWSTVLEHDVATKTEHIRRSTAELERSEAKYRSLIESAEDLIFTLDPDGMIRTANQHMSKLMGVGTEQLLGRSLHRFLPKPQADEQLDLIKDVLSSGKGRRAETVFDIRGQNFWFNIQYIPIRGADDGQEYVLGIARDITDRKSLERQLINTEKLASLGTLAAGVAHEINNPLGIMLGFCDLLLEKFEPGTMEFNDLKTIERHGLHCKSIVERLLSFARISEETEEHCSLNDNIESILSVAKHTLGMNNIALVTRIPEELPQVKADPRGIQQVILNLVSNAIHAMDGRGVLTVECRSGSRPGTVEVSISDTGCGIPSEFLQKIFDPFFTTKKVGEGTGLGLSVSFGIISKYGGVIECESRSSEEYPGQSGTTFTIVLPSVVSESTEEIPGTEVGSSDALAH